MRPPFFCRGCGMLALATGLLVMGCSTARVDVPRPLTQAIAHPEETLLGRSAAAQLAATPDQSGFNLLVSGQEAFLARAALAEAAERTLDLQYYIVAQDASATLLLYRALRAAQRGVRVRLLIDDIYAVGRDFDLAALATHPNVQIRVFNPFTYRGPFGLSRLFEWLGDGDRLNRRMHNKLWIADNAVAVIGGRNLGDAYFNVGTDNDFADLDVLAAGPVVQAMSNSFDAYWNSASATPVGAFLDTPPGAEHLEQALSRMAANAERFRASAYAQALRVSGIGPLLRAGRFPLVSAHASVFDTGVPAPAAKGATDAARPVAVAIRQLVEGAQHEAMLISPYFIPSARGVEFLCGLVKRGVHVRVLTNSLASTDVPVVHAGYARYRPGLLACGVELHEMRPRSSKSGKTRAGLSSGASLHAKAVMVDGRSVLIGSMNLDPRSRLSNSEIAVLIESPILAQQIGALFEEATSPEQAFGVELTELGDANAALAWRGSENGQPVRYEDEPLASWWRRLVAGLLGVLAPEELL
jgi:putative cardiolipin synthase